MTTSTTTTDPAAPPARTPLPDRVAQAVGWAQPADTIGITTHGRGLLDALLADLAELSVTLPAGVTRALALDADAAALIGSPPDIAAWLAAADLDKLTAEQLVDQMRECFLSLGVRSGAVVDDHQGVQSRPGDLARQAGVALLGRALDALADGLDDVFDQLRPRWDDAAAAVHAAAAAGITATMTADEVIDADDAALVAHWRALPAAVAALDQIDAAAHRALFMTGYPMGVDEQARRGRAEWLRACRATPVELVAPSARPIVHLTKKARAAGTPSPVAVRLGQQRHAQDAAEGRARTVAERRERDAQAGVRHPDYVYAGEAYPTLRIGAAS